MNFFVEIGTRIWPVYQTRNYSMAVTLDKRLNRIVHLTRDLDYYFERMHMIDQHTILSKLPTNFRYAYVPFEETDMTVTKFIHSPDVCWTGFVYVPRIA